MYGVCTGSVIHAIDPNDPGGSAELPAEEQ